MAEQCEVVAFRSVPASTACSFLWTHRITSCDVISIVRSKMSMKCDNCSSLVAVVDMSSIMPRLMYAPGNDGASIEGCPCRRAGD